MVYFCVLAGQSFNATEVLSVGSRNQPAIRITLGQNSREKIIRLSLVVIPRPFLMVSL